MAKYSPKENSYKEMYLINKFQKDIMETSLQKLKNNKKDTIESLVSSNNSNSDEHKGILENKDQKVSQPFITVQNDNVTDPVNDPEAINLSIFSVKKQVKKLHWPTKNYFFSNRTRNFYIFWSRMMS